MIAKSDLVILVVSASLLTAGIYRWQRSQSSLSSTRAIAQLPASESTAGNVQDQQMATSIGNPSFDTRQQLAGNRQTGNLNAAPAIDNGAAAGSATVTAFQSNDTGNKQSNGQTESSIAAVQTSTSRPNEPLYGTYVVQSGDYLGKIAETFGTTVARLQEINSISGSLIEIDQVIRYPLPAN